MTRQTVHLLVLISLAQLCVLELIVKIVIHMKVCSSGFEHKNIIQGVRMVQWFIALVCQSVRV